MYAPCLCCCSVPRFYLICQLTFVVRLLVLQNGVDVHWLGSGVHWPTVLANLVIECIEKNLVLLLSEETEFLTQLIYTSRYTR